VRWRNAPQLGGSQVVRGRTLTYDGLTAFRRVGGSDGTQLAANLATALPLPTDGGRSYTFTVRSRIHYSDGTLLRAEDFKRASYGSLRTRIVGGKARVRVPSLPLFTTLSRPHWKYGRNAFAP